MSEIKPKTIKDKLYCHDDCPHWGTNDGEWTCDLQTGEGTGFCSCGWRLVEHDRHRCVPGIFRRQADLEKENPELKARVAELETLLDQKIRCQCSDEEACLFARQRDEAEAKLDKIRDAANDTNVSNELVGICARRVLESK